MSMSGTPQQESLVPVHVHGMSHGKAPRTCFDLFHCCLPSNAESNHEESDDGEDSNLDSSNQGLILENLGNDTKEESTLGSDQIVGTPNANNKNGSVLLAFLQALLSFLLFNLNNNNNASNARKQIQSDSKDTEPLLNVTKDDDETDATPTITDELHEQVYQIDQVPVISGEE